MVFTVSEEELEEKYEELDQLIAQVESQPHHPYKILMDDQREQEYLLSDALSSSGFSAIATLPNQSDLTSIIETARQGRASAFAFATEGGGIALKTLTDLLEEGDSIPVLRTDYILHKLQVAETVALGGAAVLLLVDVLGEDIIELTTFAHKLGLDVAIEINDEDQMDLFLASSADIAIINTIDPETQQCDYQKTGALRGEIPVDVIAIAKGGLDSIADANHLCDQGYDGILLYKTLFKQEAPHEIIKAIRAL